MEAHNVNGFQLTLPVTLQDTATFDNYFPGPNAKLVAYLKEFIADGNVSRNQKNHYLFLSGQPGAGCSHLLQACCHTALSQHFSAVYINFQQMQLQPAVLENLELMKLICLDGLEYIVGKAEWEESVFHLFNRIMAQGSFLIISASLAPKFLSIQLPDLVSRLASGIYIYLHNLNDEEKMAALQLRGAQRGLTVNDEVGQFLLRHYSRNMSALFAALDQLDKASLVAKRKLTIPFIKEVLSI